MDAKTLIKQFFRPTEMKILIFAAFILIGSLNLYYNWHTKLGPQEDVFSVSLKPGLFPPLIFEETCNELESAPQKHVGWGCQTTYCISEYCPPRLCKASCEINLTSYIYTIGYWYLLSSIIWMVLFKIWLEKKEESTGEEDTDRDLEVLLR